MLKDLIRRTHVLEVILAFCRLLIKVKSESASSTSLTLLRLIITMSWEERKQTKKGIKETEAEKIKPAQAAETQLAEMCCRVFWGEKKQEKLKAKRWT